MKNIYFRVIVIYILIYDETLTIRPLNTHYSSNHYLLYPSSLLRLSHSVCFAGIGRPKYKVVNDVTDALTFIIGRETLPDVEITDTEQKGREEDDANSKTGGGRGGGGGGQDAKKILATGGAKSS